MGRGSRGNDRRTNDTQNDSQETINITYNGHCATCDVNVWATRSITISRGAHGFSPCTMDCPGCGGSVSGMAHF